MKEQDHQEGKPHMRQESPLPPQGSLRIFGLFHSRLLSRSELELLWAGEPHNSPATQGALEEEVS